LCSCLSLTFSGGAIPDAAAIHEARKKRQAAREGAGGADFVPLNDRGRGKVNLPGNGSSSSSRVRRDEQDDDSGEEGRITMDGVRTSRRDRELRIIDANLRESAYDDDLGREEDQHGLDSADEGEVEGEDWEEQQIRKAISKVQMANELVGVQRGPAALPPHLPSNGGPPAPRQAPVAMNLLDVKNQLNNR